jgi:N-acetylmuramoyl-L-alanine amidase
MKKQKGAYLMTKIVLDAGHGGTDGGAQGNGLSEKVLTLKIVQKIQKILETYDNTEIVLTRSGDSFLSLSQRADKANDLKADLFLSVHINSATNTKAKGFESFIYSGTPSHKTQALQNGVHEEIMKQIKGEMNDRGKKRANFAVLRQTNMSAMLTENGFIVNTGDAKLLKDDSFLDKLALGHANGIVNFLGLKKSATAKTSGSNIAPAQNVRYRVQVGAFASKKNAQDLVNRLKKDGYNAFIDQQ